MAYASQNFEKLTDQIATLPGIGKKTALRLALFIIQQDEIYLQGLGSTIKDIKQNIKFCKICSNISDTDVCNICNNSSRKHDLICVVENIRDVIAIENTQEYNGVYHVLGGLISPLDGISPENIHIAELLHRVQQNDIKEIIFALSPNIAGDTTIFYIQKQLNLINDNIKTTSIARGISFGGDLEYADEHTLSKSILNRLPINTYIKY